MGDETTVFAQCASLFTACALFASTLCWGNSLGRSGSAAGRQAGTRHEGNVARVGLFVSLCHAGKSLETWP